MCVGGLLGLRLPSIPGLNNNLQSGMSSNQPTTKTKKNKQPTNWASQWQWMAVFFNFIEHSFQQIEEGMWEIISGPYLIIVIFFTLTQFLENKIYTEKARKLRQNTQKIANFLRYYGKIHSKLPIFCVKSVKIYTGQKKFTQIYSWRSWQISGMNRHRIWKKHFSEYTDNVMGGVLNVIYVSFHKILRHWRQSWPSW